MHQKNTKKKTTVKLSVVIISAFIFLGIIISAFSVFTYANIANTSKRILFPRLVFLPVAIVDGRFITINSFESDFFAMKKYYETQDFSSFGLKVDFSSDDGKKRLEIKKKQLLNKMIEDKSIEVAAKENGIVISDDQLNKSVNKKLDEYGNKENVQKDLENHYGWGLEEFKQKIVLPSLYQEALSEKIKPQLEIANKEAKEKVEAAQKELKSGVAFEDVVKKYSQSESAKKGGELGWVNKENVVSELSEALFGAKESEKYAIIESSIGYHIVDIEEKKKEEQQDVLRIRQIFLRKKTFNDWLAEKMTSGKIYLFLSGFKWDQEKATVEFSSDEMNKFEQDQSKNSQTDASMIF